ncbi:hypothetical protein GCM10025868_44050 [Angustibacter aerolatus]|uniref:Uncharacterized protein n=1 Tax=Angustibacter aerolatus TaxID=1162965 RepID=A0ABQ6JR33_9ACTN|nr:hypothetical protein GCM10025868_44050 [Angustibacter aerolatus]
MLWQLPPRMRFDAERVESFLAMLPHTTTAAAALALEHDDRMTDREWTTTDADRPLRHAMEVRHASFADPSFTAMLREHDVALVRADTGGRWPEPGRRDVRPRLPAAARRRGACT